MNLKFNYTLNYNSSNFWRWFSRNQSGFRRVLQFWRHSRDLAMVQFQRDAPRPDSARYAAGVRFSWCKLSPRLDTPFHARNLPRNTPVTRDLCTIPTYRYNITLPLFRYRTRRRFVSRRLSLKYKLKSVCLIFHPSSEALEQTRQLQSNRFQKISYDQPRYTIPPPDRSIHRSIFSFKIPVHVRSIDTSLSIFVYIFIAKWFMWSRMYDPHLDANAPLCTHLADEYFSISYFYFLTVFSFFIIY